MSEKKKFWCADDIGRVELLQATFINHTFPRHTHDGYVIGVIERGVESFYYRHTVHHALPGQIVVINPDEVHTGHSGTEEGWTYRMMYPDADILGKLLADMAQGAKVLPFFPEPVLDDTELAARLLRLHRLLEISDNFLKRQTLFNQTLAELILRHAECRARPAPVGHEHQTVGRIRDYLNDTYRRNTSLEELSELAGLSPFYLTRIFRRQTGLPPHAYLTQIRIQRAKELLAQKIPIARVAAETGFVDQSHLHRHFKRITGVTPRQFMLGF